MSSFTIFVDDREQKPYKFNRYPVNTEDKRLETADYCVKGDGIEGETDFIPHYGVERKSGKDFLNSITWERDRFEDELARADNFYKRMPVVVEEPWPYFENEQYYKNVGVNSIKGTIDCHPEMFNIDYFFNRDRQKAEQLTFEFLKLRNSKISKRR